ncbi:MAG: radical SAM/SPASM domain-containing protein, partial [Enterococcus sp.]|nr:radical SAM/SPASM domain-containing protein [Enterococcus sp.]
CEKKEASVLCQTCPFQQMCHGGCKRMKAAMYVNAAGDFCGYQRFLQTFLPEVTIIQTYLQAL